MRRWMNSRMTSRENLSERSCSDDTRAAQIRQFGRGPARARTFLCPPGSEEFMAGYKAALAGGSPSPAPSRRKGKPEIGTLRWLCQEYFASGTFRNELSPRTKYVRRRELEKVCET